MVYRLTVIENMIHIHGKITEFYPYRTARVVPLITIDDLDDFDHRIIKRRLENAGYQIDNHICFKADTELYYWYSDNKLIVGTQICIENW